MNGSMVASSSVRPHPRAHPSFSPPPPPVSGLKHGSSSNSGSAVSGVLLTSDDVEVIEFDDPTRAGK